MKRFKLPIFGCVFFGLVFASHPAFGIFQVRETRLPDHVQKLEDRYKAVDYSKVYTIDKIYPSMAGPADYHRLLLWDNKSPELLWITSISQQVLSPQGAPLKGSQNFCHGHFSLGYSDEQLANRKSFLGQTSQKSRKLFSLVQGQESVRFPDGFGFPVLSNEPFYMGSMVLNYEEIEKPFDVKIKSEIEFKRDKEMPENMSPLFKVLASVKVPVLPESLSDHQCETDTLHTNDGVIGNSPSKAVDASLASRDSDGIVRDGHWFVPPGRHVYRYQLQKGFGLSYDTTAHFIAVHLHAFGESLELKDLTTNQTVFKSMAKNQPTSRGILESDHYSSTEGIPIYQDHEYELTAIYNNSLNEDIDAMAVMYLYLKDKQFDKNQLVVKK